MKHLAGKEDPYETFEKTNPVGAELTKLRPRASRPDRERSVLPRPVWSSLSCLERRGVIDCIIAAFRNFPNAGDARGWNGQAWMHCLACMGGLPFGSVHDNWLFLPWHRAFLYFHEKMIRYYSGNDSFRLPAWDWEVTSQNRFPREHALGRYPLNALLYLVAGFEGPQYVSSADYSPSGPPAAFQCKITQASATAWLRDPRFVGGATATPAAFNGPHLSIHLEDQALFGEFRTSALHPVFYAHHGNVDRFFEQWLRWNGPIQEWKNTQLHFFGPADSQLFVISAYDACDAAALGYRYETRPVQVEAWAEPIELEVNSEANAFGFSGTRWELLLRDLETLDRSAENVSGDLAQSPILQILFRIPAGVPEGRYVVSVSRIESGQEQASFAVGSFGKAKMSVMKMRRGQDMDGRPGTPDVVGLALDRDTRVRLFGADPGGEGPQFKAFFQTMADGACQGTGERHDLELSGVNVLYPQAFDTM